MTTTGPASLLRGRCVYRPAVRWQSRLPWFRCPDWRDKAWLQSVAMEMNLSETAFLVPNAQGFDLRWFTPKVEVDLCGHATLASALVVSHLGLQADRPEILFSTRSGILKALVQKDRIQLDFPIVTGRIKPAT